MKFYSETLDEIFDSQEELEKAETSYLSNAEKEDLCEQEAEDAEEAIEEVEEKSPSKKDLAEAVEKSDEALKEAYALRDVAKGKVRELSAKYLSDVDAIMKEANEAVAKAEREKYEAIKAFNDRYGAYKITYTGARAAEEFKRAMRTFIPRDRWLNFFDNFFTF